MYTAKQNYDRLLKAKRRRKVRTGKGGKGWGEKNRKGREGGEEPEEGGGRKDKKKKGGGEGRKEGCIPETDDESNDNLH